MWLYIKVVGIIVGAHLIILLASRYFIQRLYRRDQALLEQELNQTSGSLASGPESASLSAGTSPRDP